MGILGGERLSTGSCSCCGCKCSQFDEVDTEADCTNGYPSESSHTCTDGRTKVCYACCQCPDGYSLASCGSAPTIDTRLAFNNISSSTAGDPVCPECYKCGFVCPFGSTATSTRPDDSICGVGGTVVITSYDIGSGTWCYECIAGCPPGTKPVGFPGFEGSGYYEYMALLDWDCCLIDSSNPLSSDSYTDADNGYHSISPTCTPPGATSPQVDGHIVYQAISSFEDPCTWTATVVEATGNYASQLGTTITSDAALALASGGLPTSNTSSQSSGCITNNFTILSKQVGL